MQELLKRPLGTAALAACAAGALALCACGGMPETDGGPPLLRKLTEAQYRQSIADLFGDDIRVAGRFEPEVREDGLFAVGASTSTVTSSGLEQFYQMAGSVAAQVFEEKRRERFATCPQHPEPAQIPDCAKSFVRTVGRRLFRRELESDELEQWTGAIAASAEKLGDLDVALKQALAGMLVSSEFLFRVEGTEPDPGHPGEPRLTGYAKAARLSFLLWNTAPDAELLDAAASGALHDEVGLAAQVDRLLADRVRLERGVRAFFEDFLRLESFDTLEKDKLIYPAFNKRVSDDAREQLLRFAVDHLLAQQGDYRDLFTSRKTFMTRPLGMLAAVPVTARDGWEPFEFPEGDPRAGLLAQVGFTALHSHPGRSSATLRGIAVREILLCQTVAPAPAAVNFTVVQDTSNPDLRTARARLTAHRTSPECAGCHRVIDPIGLALEHFDGAGMYRAVENGDPIDTSGDLDGKHFETAVDLGQILHDHPGVPACFVSSLYRYGVGRSATPGEGAWLRSLEKSFAKQGFQLVPLLRGIATSEALYKIAIKPASPVRKAALPEENG